MAIYYFHAKPIQRSKGSSAVGAAAYRSASRLYDERQGRFHNFAKKVGVIHSEILTPDGQEHAALDRGRLWNAVEGRETRRNAIVAREVTFALPREFGREEGLRLARDFVMAEMTRIGMIADLNIHWDPSKSGLPQPHAHVLLTTRRLLTPPPHGPGDPPALSFGLKDRTWHARAHLIHWREALAEHLNIGLAELGYDIHLSHRSHKALGVGLEPTIKIGAASARRRAQHQPADRMDQNEDIAARNGDRIIADPLLALHALTLQLSTFTRHDLGQFLRRHSDDPDQFQTAMTAVLHSSQTIILGRDQIGRERLTSLQRLVVEARMENRADVLATRFEDPGEKAKSRAFRVSGLDLIVAVEGPAKIAAVAATRQISSAEGWGVQGVAPSGELAARLTAQTGLPAMSVNHLEHRGQDPDSLSRTSVVLVDGAGLLGGRQLDMILSFAERSGARVVLISDPGQPRGAEIGAGFRGLAERWGAFDLSVSYPAPGFGWTPPSRRPAEREFIMDGSEVPWVRAAYVQRFAERRGIQATRRLEPSAMSFEGPALSAWDERSVHRVIRQYALAVITVEGAWAEKRLPTNLERRTLARADSRAAALWPGASQMAKTAALADPRLLEEAAAGSTRPLLLAMEAHAERLLEMRVLERWRSQPRHGVIWDR